MQRERPANTTLAFHASRIVTDVGVLLAMASMSMSFVVADSGDRSALDADALPAVILLLPVFILTLIPDHTRPLHPAAAWAALAFGLAALPYALVKMLDAAILADTLDGSVGLGGRLLITGCLIALLGIGIGLYRNLRGLPSGGALGRSSTERSRTKAPSKTTPIAKKEAGAAPRQPAKATAASQAPTRLLPAAAQEKQDKQDQGTQAESKAVTAQPEIVFPDTGAVAREADEEPAADPDPLLDTAERADAALDDHLWSMLDSQDEGDPEGEEGNSG